MPRSPRDVGHVVICCRVPHTASPADATRWQAEATSRGVPVTWSVAPEAVETWLESCDTQSAVAVQIGNATVHGSLQREEIRSCLRHAGGRLAAAVVHNDRPLDHRGLFVEGGIEIVATHKLHAVDRQSRRPPPAGWDCRCLQWGLWEAGFSSPRRRLFGLVEDRRPQAGRLTLLATGCDDHDRPDAGLAKLRQTLVQVEAAVRSRGVRASLLSDLPRQLQGGAAPEDRGSILAAA
jgi:hypothetical protein